MAGDDGSGSEDEDHVDLKIFRTKLLDHIQGIEAAGSVATSNVVHEFPNPGICVDEGDIIGLPLSAEDARRLATHSRKAPFGLNRETIVDEAVRKTWEIGADRIRFKNPRWADFVDRSVQRVAYDLGVPPGEDGEIHVRAELYKNLLYEPGAMFKPHRDTEKAPGMFATLVICLPSEHTGGTVALQHGGKSIRLSTEESSAFDCSFLAWYADVTHEVEPVLTGHRWVLTYNLINESRGSCLSAEALESQTEKIANHLSQWDSLPQPPDFLAFPLQHLYTTDNMRLDKLKDQDFQRVRCVSDSCTRIGDFCLLLAHVKMHKKWPADVRVEDSFHTTYWHTLSHMTDLNGTLLSPLDMGSRESFVVGNIYPTDRDANQHVRGGGYLGNEPAENEKIYCDTVMIIVPKRSFTRILINDRHGRGHRNDLIDHLRKVLKGEKLKEGNEIHTLLRDFLRQLCRDIIAEDDYSKDDSLGTVAAAAIFLRDASLFHTVQVQTEKRWDNASYYRLGRDLDLQDLHVDENDLKAVFTKEESLYCCYEHLHHFLIGFLEANPNRGEQSKAKYFKDWANERMIEMLRILHGNKEDAAAVVRVIQGQVSFSTPEKRAIIDLTRNYFEPERANLFRLEYSEAVENEVLAFVHRNLTGKEFATELLIRLIKNLLIDPKRVGATAACHLLLRNILETAISTFDFTALLKHKHHIGALYDLVLAYNEDAASRLLWKIQMNITKGNKRVAKRDLQRLMEELIPLVNTDSLEAQYFFQSVVKAYITTATFPEPKDWNLSRKVKKRCSKKKCRYCPQVDGFLGDPVARERVMAFESLDSSTVSHLEHRYLSMDIEKEDDTRVRLTKTWMGWKELHIEWERQVRKAEKFLQSLPQDKLQELLADQYDMLMDLESATAKKNSASHSTTYQPPESHWDREEGTVAKPWECRPDGATSPSVLSDVSSNED